MLDPFVGTGSILVPAAHLGALTMGTDIDIRVIKIGEQVFWGGRAGLPQAFGRACACLNTGQQGAMCLRVDSGCAWGGWQQLRSGGQEYGA